VRARPRARLHGCVRACAVACARDGCVRARLRACVRMYVLPACVRPSRFTILFVPHTHCSLYRTVPNIFYTPRTARQDKTTSFPCVCARVHACALACVCMCCGSGADPFAALVTSTPVSYFILNSKTTCSYLFILLKNSIGTHLELLEHFCCVQRLYMSFYNILFLILYASYRTVPNVTLFRLKHSSALLPYGTVPTFIIVQIAEDIKLFYTAFYLTTRKKKKN
jgi:hypothetical protein